MRLAWVLKADLPRPLCNAPVFDATGRHLGTPDLLDPVVGLVAEYDGSGHLGHPSGCTTCAARASSATTGLEYVTTVAGDRRGPRGFVERLLRAYARSLAARDRGERPGWTSVPPRAGC